MSTPSLIILTEPRGLKAILVAAVPGYGFIPRLVEVFRFAETADRGVHAREAPAPSSFWKCAWFGVSSRPSRRKEDPWPGCREATRQIQALLDRYQPVRWGLVAPEERAKPILQKLSANCQRTLEQVIHRDLSRAEVAEVVEEFMETQSLH